MEESMSASGLQSSRSPCANTTQAPTQASPAMVSQHATLFPADGEPRSLSCEGSFSRASNLGPHPQPLLTEPMLNLPPAGTYVASESDTVSINFTRSPYLSPPPPAPGYIPGISYVAPNDRLAYYGPFDFLGLPPELQLMVYYYLIRIRHTVVKVPNGHMIRAIHDWDTVTQGPGAQKPRRGRSHQIQAAKILQCCKQISEFARPLVYAKRTHVFKYLNSVWEFRASIGQDAYIHIRHLVLSLRRFKTRVHAANLVVLQNLKTVALLCDNSERTTSPLHDDLASRSLYDSQVPLSRVGRAELTPDSMINDFVLEMHRHRPEAKR